MNDYEFAYQWHGDVHTLTLSVCVRCIQAYDERLTWLGGGGGGAL